MENLLEILCRSIVPFGQEFLNSFGMDIDSFRWFQTDHHEILSLTNEKSLFF